MKRALVWFRNDLRVHDNIVLTTANANFDELIPVYIFDELNFKETRIGLPKTGPYRANFLIETVLDLRAQLSNLGGDLIVRRGNVVEEIMKLVDQFSINTVVASKECTYEELHIEGALEKVLHQKGVALNLYWQSTLYYISDIPWPIQHLPSVFSDFRKQLERESTIRETLAPSKAINIVESVYPGEVPKLEELGLILKRDDRAVIDFKGGETEAWKRLRYYIWESDLVAIYKETRNGLMGGDYSSKLSPWLAMGAISPRSVFWEVKKYEAVRSKNSSTYWLVFELMWRDYFRFIAKKHGSKVFRKTGIKQVDLPLKNDLNSFEKWKGGKTGVDFVDANMQELKQTGFMSNRGRQNVASYLVNDLKVNWTWGASYFETMLIDYDPCSNWGNWNYIAGTGNDPRKNRYFNIENQSNKYDPSGNYIRYWLESKNLISK